MDEGRELVVAFSDYTARLSKKVRFRYYTPRKSAPLYKLRKARNRNKLARSKGFCYLNRKQSPSQRASLKYNQGKTMNKGDLVNKIAEECEMSKAAADKAVTACSKPSPTVLHPVKRFR